MKRVTRNRVLDDRLWDAEGLVWTCKRGDWADGKQVRAFLGRNQNVFVHGPDGNSWMTQPEALAWWAKAHRHFEVPGDSTSEQGPDENGRTFGAKVWRREDKRLLGIQIFC